MLCIDDYSRMTWILFLKHKVEELEKFETFKNQAKNYVQRRIKYLRSNRGGEFIANDFNEFCHKYGITR